jgi:hypothetical protein
LKKGRHYKASGCALVSNNVFFSRGKGHFFDVLDHGNIPDHEAGFGIGGAHSNFKSETVETAADGFD